MNGPLKQEKPGLPDATAVALEQPAAGPRRPRFYLAVFLFIALFVNLDGFALGRFSLVRLLDHHDVYFYRMKSMGEMLLKYGITAWNPNNLAGVPNYAGSLHPTFLLNLPAAFLPTWFVSALLNILLYCAILIGTYLYLRDIMGLREQTAFAGGILHLCAFFVSNVNVFTSWGDLLPLMLVCSYRITKASFRTGPYILLLAVLFSVLYVPYAVPFMPVTMLLLILIHFRHDELAKHLAVFAAVWLGYLAFHAPDIYSILAAVPTGHRQAFALPTASAAESLAGLLTGTGHLVYPLLFLVPFALLGREKRKLAGLISALTLSILVIYFLSGWSLINRVYLYLPVLKQFSLARFGYVTAFLFASLAAIGWQNLIDWTGPSGSRKKAAVLISAFFFAIATFLVGSNQWLLFTVVTMSVAAAVMISLTSTRQGQAFILLLIFPALLASKADFHLREKHTSYKSAFDVPVPPPAADRTPFRTVSLLNTANRYASFPAQENVKGMETIDGIEMIYPLSFRHFWQAVERDRQDLAALDKAVDFSRWGNRISAVSLDGRLRLNLNLLALANVKFIYSSIPLKPRDDIELVYKRKTDEPPALYKQEFVSGLKARDADKSYQVLKKLVSKWKRSPTVYLYRVKTAFPRAWLASGAQARRGEQGVLEALDKASITDLRRNAYLSRASFSEAGLPATGLDARKDSRGTAKIIKYTPDKIDVRVKTERPAFLMVANSFDKRWRASIDGAPAPLVRADGAFQGVPVAKGAHLVRLAFVDRPVLWLHLLFPLWLMAALAATLTQRKLP